MTGAGSGKLILGREADFMGDLADNDGDSTPDLFAPGRNPSLTELSLENQLELLSEGDDVEAKESIKTNFEGAVGIEAVASSDTLGNVEELVFNDGGTSFTTGLARTGRVFTGVTYPSGSADRELLGCAPLEYSIDYEQGGMTTVSLTMAYADEKPGSSVDLSTATRVSTGTSIPFHGFDLTLDGTTVSDLQSCSLSISNISRFHRGPNPTPTRAVMAKPETTLDVEAILSSPSRLDLARGASDGTLPNAIDSVSGAVELAVNGETVSTYNLPRVKPDQYQWNEVLSSDDTTDSTTFNVTGGVNIA